MRPLREVSQSKHARTPHTKDAKGAKVKDGLPQCREHTIVIRHRTRIAGIAIRIGFHPERGFKADIRVKQTL